MQKACGGLQFLCREEGRKGGREEGREEKERKKKLQKKREGTQQIEPFHHTLTSFTSAGIAKSFPHK